MQMKIYKTNSQIEKINQDIARYQGMIDVTSSEKVSLASIIKELTLTRSKLLAEKSKIEKQIQSTGFVIGSLKNNITEKQTKIEMSRKSVASLMYKEYQNEKLSVLQVVLSGEKLKDVGAEYYATAALSKKLDDSMKDFTATRNELMVSKTKKEQEEKNLKVLKNNLAQQQKVVEVAKTEKDTLLQQTKNKEAEYKKLLADQEKKRDEFEKALSDYESQLKFLLNPKLLPNNGSEILAWPLDKVFITQLFGKTASSGRLYVSGSHSGVDFRAPIGTPVKAMAEGTVMGVGNTDDYCKKASFGKWVFIKYNNGLSSTFGHLSVINAVAGQKVKAGDMVAYSGNTGHSTGPHLHVTVYASQGSRVDTVPSLSCSGKTFIMPIAPTSAYLDPMLYLPKKIPAVIKTDNPRD